MNLIRKEVITSLPVSLAYLLQLLMLRLYWLSHFKTSWGENENDGAEGVR